MSLFSDAWRDDDSKKLETDGMVDMGDIDPNSIKGVIGSPNELMTDLKGSINQSLGEYAKWTTTGLLTAVKDPMRFAERQRTMAHPYFTNPDDGLVRDNVQNLIADRESKRAILDATEKAALLGRVEAVADMEEEGALTLGEAFNKKAVVAERMAMIGKMIDTYKSENKQGALTPATRLDALKKWSTLKDKQGWFYVTNDHIQFDKDDRTNLEMFDRMPIGAALEKAGAHSFSEKNPETGVKQKYIPVPYQTMLHMVIDDAFKDGLRVAKIAEWTTPRARTAAIGAALPHNYEGMDDASAPYATEHPAFEGVKQIVEKAAKRSAPVGNVFANATDYVKGIIPWGKKAKSEDEASLEASLAQALGQSSTIEARKAPKSVLVLANSGADAHVKIAPFDDQMRAEFSSDMAAQKVAENFDNHLENRVCAKFGVAKWEKTDESGARFGKSSRGSTVRAMPFSISSAHIGAAMLTPDAQHNYEASVYGYKLADSATPNDLHEVGVVHLRPKNAVDRPRTMLYETSAAASGGRVMKDIAQHAPSMKMSMPSAANLEKSVANASGFSAEYQSTDNKHRAGLKVFEFY